MKARETPLRWIAGARWRACSVLALLATFGVIVGRELESPDPFRAIAVAAFTFVLAIGWLVATFRFAWWSIAAIAASSIALTAVGHFLSGSAGITAAILALALLLDLRSALAFAIPIGVAASAALLVSLGSAVPAVHAIFIGAFWILAFLLGRYVRFAQTAKGQAEQLLVLAESVRRERERAAALQERTRIAREIHDILADTLSALAAHLERARASVDGDDTEAAELIEEAQRLARRGLGEVGSAVATLRGDDSPGLALLPRLAHDFERQTGTPCALTVADGSAALPVELQAALFRVAQEALTNVRKHAVSRRVDVKVRCPPGRVELIVENHGLPRSRGRREAADASGYGIAGMRERAALLGGELVATDTRDGFSVRLTLPRR